MTSWIIAILILAVVGVGAMTVYSTRMPGQSYQNSPHTLSEQGQTLRDRLQDHVRQLAAEIGERNADHYAALTKARDYIAEQFRLAGYDPVLLPFEYGGQTFHNVEAVLTSPSPSPKCLVIGAHYDTVPGSPGANDNASGVAVVLELARILADRSLPTTVRFVGFVNEEPPYFITGKGMGSVEYARRLHNSEQDVRGMMSIETVGFYSDTYGSQHYPPLVGALYPDRGNFIAFVGNLSSRPFVRETIGAFRQVATLPSEGTALPSWIPGVSWSDHRSFWHIGAPALMVTDTAPFRYPHYHLPTDTPEQLDYESMARLVQGLEHAVIALTDQGS